MADFIASYALSLPLGLHILNYPSVGVLPFLTHDMYGVSYPQLALLEKWATMTENICHPILFITKFLSFIVAPLTNL